jgi:nitroimidazol reductase NimA-like FMN-containing flavoprotein (pyridoxamine 5'-phosphate oxidase superfamily)
MGMADDRDGTTLTRAECFEFLARASVGRIGVSIGALPVILPVHFAVHDQSVLLRTTLGTKLDAATLGSVVAFQADGWEQEEETYWSVLLQGIASEVEEGSHEARSVPIQSWGRMHQERRLVRIQTTNAYGKRFFVAGGGTPPELPDAPPLGR